MPGKIDSLIWAAIVTAVFGQFTGDELLAQDHGIVWQKGPGRMAILSFKFAGDRMPDNSPGYDHVLQTVTWKKWNPIHRNHVSLYPDNYFDPELESKGNSWQRVGPEGGVVSVIKTYDQDTSIIFAGTVDGGFYKSVDGGRSWQLKGANESIQIGSGEFITDIEIAENTVYSTGTSGLLWSRDLGESWEPLLITLSGQLTAIEINPQDTEIMYIGHYTGGGIPDFVGVLKTVDGGMNWRAVDDGLVSRNVTNLVMSTKSPEVLYAATLGGIFVTMDGGASGWKDISGNLADREIYAFHIDQAHDSTLYAGTRTGIFKTSNFGHTWVDITGENFKSRFISRKGLAEAYNIVWAGTDRGLYRSSDSGRTWQEKTNGLTNTSIGAIEINQDNIKLGTADGFYRSTNSGESWQKSSRGFTAFDVEAMVFDTNVNPTRVLVGVRGAGLYTSDDAGEHWRDIETEEAPFFTTALAIHPDSGQILYAGVIQYARDDGATIVSGVYRSTDAGKTWGKTGLEGSVIDAIAIDPASAQTLYAGTSNGVYKSTDAGVTWLRKSDGIAVEYIRCLAIDPQDPNTVYAGAMFGIIDSKLGIYKSTNGGELWQYQSNGLPLASAGRRDVEEICINPLNPQTIYACLVFDGIYKTTNGGRNWQKVLELRNIDYPFSITIDPHDTNRVYVGGVKIYKSDNAGQTWQEMMEGLRENYGHVKAIRVDPNDPRRIYAATYGFGVLRYYRTATAVEEPGASAPNAFALHQNYPNPFNPGTTIEFQTNQAGRVAIRIYDVHGRLVRALLDEHKPAGEFSVPWNGRDDAGQRVASGIYVYRLTAGNFTEAKKMVLLQ